MGSMVGQIKSKVQSIVGSQLGIDLATIVPEANLLDDLGADSLDVVELVMALEEAFGIEVADEDVDNIRTIGDIVSYLDGRVIVA